MSEGPEPRRSLEEIFGQPRRGGLFESDILLPMQYLDTIRRIAETEPEKRLMLGILEDAVQCIQKYVNSRSDKGKEIYRDAEEWILEQNNDWPFSYKNICDFLGFDPDYVRQGLFRWKEKRLEGRVKAIPKGTKRISAEPQY